MQTTQTNTKLTKVLHVIQCLRPGGIESMVLTLSEKGDGLVFVLAIDGDKQNTIKSWQRAKNNEANLFFLDKATGISLKAAYELRKLIKQHQFDVVHSHHIGPLLYTCVATVGMKNIIHVHTEHDAWHLQSGKNYWLERLLLKTNPSVHHVAVSKRIQQQLHRLFPKNKVHFINNGVDTGLYKPAVKPTLRKALSLPQTKTLIITAGRLEQVKGQTYLIEALSYLDEHYHLIIAGDGSLKKKLCDLATSLKLEESVSFLGNVDNLVVYYQACDVFCLPSLNEGLPLVLLEAQACGLPVVCSEVGGCADAVDRESGILVEAGDSKALAQAIENVTDKQHNPREFIMANYSLNQLQSHYNNLYRGQ